MLTFAKPSEYSSADFQCTYKAILSDSRYDTRGIGNFNIAYKKQKRFTFMSYRRPYVCNKLIFKIFL